LRAKGCISTAPLIQHAKDSRKRKEFRRFPKPAVLYKLIDVVPEATLESALRILRPILPIFISTTGNPLIFSAIIKIDVLQDVTEVGEVMGAEENVFPGFERVENLDMTQVLANQEPAVFQGIRVPHPQLTVTGYSQAGSGRQHPPLITESSDPLPP